MVQGKAGQGVGFDDGVGGAFDRSFKTERAQQAAGEGGFARAQSAFEPNRQRCGEAV